MPGLEDTVPTDAKNERISEPYAPDGPVVPVGEACAEGEHAASSAGAATLDEEFSELVLPTVLPDRELLRVWLTRERRHWVHSREALVYIIFLGLFTFVVVSRKGIQKLEAHQSVLGVGGVVSTAEWNQGGVAATSTEGLYFEKTFMDIGEIDDLWEWLYANQGLMTLFGQDQNMYQQQNKILPIIRFSQRRSTVPMNADDHETQQSTGGHCPVAHQLIQTDWFGTAFGNEWLCAPEFDGNEETRDFAWPVPTSDWPPEPNARGWVPSNYIQGEYEPSSCATPCQGKASGVGCLGMKTWYDWNTATSQCTSAAATTCAARARQQGWCEVLVNGLATNSDGTPQRANLSMQNRANTIMRGIDECASSYCDNCDRDVPEWLYVGCNTESTKGGASQLKSPPGSDTGCRHLHICARALCENWTSFRNTEPLPTIGGCPCDYNFQSGWLYKEQDLASFKDSVPELGQQVPKLIGRFGTYEQKGYYFDLYAEMSTDAATAVLECYQNKDWIDAYTRQFQVQWFTYNPVTNLFINHLFFVEFPPSGFVQPEMYIHAFEWIQWEGSAEVVCDIILFVFVSWYFIKFFWDYWLDAIKQPPGSLVMERVLLPWVSVWRMVEVFNLGVFLYVFVLKFTFYQAKNVTLASFSSEVPTLLEQDSTYKADVGRVDSDTNELTGSETIWTARGIAFDAALFEFMNTWSFKWLEAGRLDAVNALLSYLKLFKFASYNPWVNLLSETIKTAATDLVALLVYVCLITCSFALMGLLLYGQHLESYSSFGTSFESLLRMAIGDFDFDELLSIPGSRYTPDRIYTDLFFFGYQILVWLILLNMVISIISEAFTKSKERQTLMIGESQFGEVIKDVLSNTIQKFACRKSKFRVRPRFGFPPGRCFPEACFRVAGTSISIWDLERSIAHCATMGEKIIKVQGGGADLHEDLETTDSQVVKVRAGSVFEAAGITPGLRILAVGKGFVGLRRKHVADAHIKHLIKCLPAGQEFDVRVVPTDIIDNRVTRQALEEQLIKDKICGTGDNCEKVARATADVLLWYMSDGYEQTKQGRTIDNRTIYSVHVARIHYRERVAPRHGRHHYRHAYWTGQGWDYSDSSSASEAAPQSEGGGRRMSHAPPIDLPSDAGRRSLAEPDPAALQAALVDADKCIRHIRQLFGGNRASLSPVAPS
eukprot:TRINITY_DN25349_c0_g1_i1.p1 TRINITY_DN25349_c0_g1~~TRINITY_DN25349_c0_g1_i1.p1  ORF type:complete len:1169 (+),score=299.89 TRINITY_DN25349_c0_g1_i1:108-3614(+)